ncbi:MAG: hypothetical protein K2X93_09145 [Candidatus Obscuribacterales bacterium]|nr:hypothetical protein [Candidatus Obscuribacterales bacterium]
MPTWGWIVAAVAGLVCIIGIVRIVIWWKDGDEKEKMRAELLEQKGQIVPCLLTMWNDRLDDPEDTSDRNAQGLFSPTTAPDILYRLKEIENSVFECEDGDSATPDERRIAFMCKTHFPMYQPCLIPARLTGGLEAYSISLEIKRSFLPNKVITVPVAFAKVAMEGDVRVAAMVPYPADFDFERYANLSNHIEDFEEDAEEGYDDDDDLNA